MNDPVTTDTTEGPADVAKGPADVGVGPIVVGGEFVSKKLCEEWRRSYRGQKLWSFATHGSTICVVVFSAIAAVMSQLADKDWLLAAWMSPKTAATSLSLLVTIISTVQAKLGFERKWVANRIKHSALDLLKLDAKTGATLGDVKTRLEEIQKRHDQAITNAAAS